MFGEDTFVYGEDAFVFGEDTSVYGDDILGRSRASALRNFLPRCLHHPSPDTPKSIPGGGVHLPDNIEW